MSDKEPEVMVRLRKIREEMYEESKGLSNEEWVKKIKDEAEECKKQYGVRLPTRVKMNK